jgi:hypothetical protein
MPANCGYFVRDLERPGPGGLLRSLAICSFCSRRSRWSTFTSIRVGKQWSAWLKAEGEGINRNQRIDPVQGRLPMHVSQRCGARTGSGRQCQSAALPNGRCRMHGGLSPGVPKRNRNALTADITRGSNCKAKRPQFHEDGRQKVAQAFAMVAVRSALSASRSSPDSPIKKNVLVTPMLFMLVEPRSSNLKAVAARSRKSSLA